MKNGVRKCILFTIILAFFISSAFGQTEYGGEEDGNLSEWYGGVDNSFSIDDGIVSGSDYSIFRSTNLSRLEAHRDLPVASAEQYSMLVKPVSDGTNNDFGYVDSNDNALWYFYVTTDAGQNDGGLFWSTPGERWDGEKILPVEDVSNNEVFNISINNINTSSNQVDVYVESLNASTTATETFYYHSNTSGYPDVVEVACNAGSVPDFGCSYYDNFTYSGSNDSGGGDSNFAPDADFSFEPVNPETAESVQFYDFSTDADGNISSWSWDFGDGNTSTSENPSHSYSSAGAYTVNLTVTDDAGATDSYTHNITVKDSQRLTYYGGEEDGNLSEWYGDVDTNFGVSDNLTDLGEFSISRGQDTNRLEAKRDIPVDAAEEYSLVFESNDDDDNNDFGFKDENDNALWYFWFSPEAGGSTGGVWYSTPNDDDSGNSRDQGTQLLTQGEVSSEETFKLTINDVDTQNHEINLTVESLNQGDSATQTLPYHNTDSDYPDFVEIAANAGESAQSSARYDNFAYGDSFETPTYSSSINLTNPLDGVTLSSPVNFNFTSENISTTDLLFNNSESVYTEKQSYNFSVSSADTGGTRKLVVGDGPDSDNYQDIFTGHLDGGIWYYESNSSAEGYFNQPVELIHNDGSGLAAANDGLSIADVNNDGHLDVIGGTSTDMRIRYGNPDSTATALNTDEQVPFNDTLILGDTGDENDYTAIGHADEDHSTGKDIFINTDFDQSIWILRRNESDSDGYSDPEKLIDIGWSTDANGIKATDLNGDGVSDLIFGFYHDDEAENDSRIYLLMSDTSNENNYENEVREIKRFDGGPNFVSEGNNGFHLLSGEKDLNDDGLPDLVAAARSTVHLFISNSSKDDYYNEPIQIDEGDWGMDNNLKQADTAFVDGDNKPDMIVPHNNDQIVYILYGDDSDDYFTSREVLKDYSDYGPNPVGLSKFVQTADSGNVPDIVVQERIQSSSPITTFEMSQGWGNYDSSQNDNFTNTDVSQFGGETIQWAVGGTDTQGNSVKSGNRTVTIEDTSTPSISIECPLNQTYSSSSVCLNLTSGGDITTGEYSLDGGANESFTPNTTLQSLEEGRRDLTVYGTDAEGYTGSASVDFTVDLSGPSMSFNSDSTEVGEQDQNYVYTSISASDNLSGVSSVTERFNGGNRSLFEDGNGDYVFNHTGLSDGEYTVEIWAEDSVGNTEYINRDITLNTSGSSDDGGGEEPGESYVISDLPAGRAVGLQSDLNQDLTQDGVSGVNTAVFGSNRDSLLATELEIDFTNNVSVSGLEFAADRSTGKAFVHNQGTVNGLRSTNLLVPRVNGTGNVLVCPGASSLNETEIGCSEGFNVSSGDSVNGVTVSSLSVSGYDYYRVSGIRGTGAVEVSSSGSPPPPSSPSLPEEDESGTDSEFNWSVSLSEDSNQSSLKTHLETGSSTEDELYLENLNGEPVTLELECGSTGIYDEDVCSWLNYSRSTVTVEPGETEEVGFAVELPLNASRTDYLFELQVMDPSFSSDSEEGVKSVDYSVSSSFLYGLTSKVTEVHEFESPTGDGRPIPVPVALIPLLLGVLVFAGLTVADRGSDVSVPRALRYGVSLFLVAVIFLLI